MSMKRCSMRRVPGLTVLACFAFSTLHADWPQWRGPELRGASPETPLPETWSATENLAWRTALPGSSNATPVVSGNRVYLTTLDRTDNNVYAMAVDAGTGAILWRHAVGENLSRGRNDMTTPSPVTDGERVIFTFGTGAMRAFTPDGALLWSHDLVEKLGNFSLMFEYGASPLLHEGVVYFPLLRRDTPYHGAPGAELPLKSYLVAFDAATGEEKWRHERPTDALHESFDAYTTPIPYRHGDAWTIILLGGDYVTAHAVEDGRELWRWGFNPRKHRNWRVVPTPVVFEDMLLFTLPRGTSLIGARITDEGITDDSIAWTLTQNIPDVVTPALYDGRLYVLDGDRRIMTVVEPRSGRVIYQESMGDGTLFRASPSAGDGKVFSMNEHGDVFVLKAGDTFEEPARIAMGGRDVRSTIAIAQGRLFIRTSDALYGVERAEP